MIEVIDADTDIGEYSVRINGNIIVITSEELDLFKKNGLLEEKNLKTEITIKRENQQ